MAKFDFGKDLPRLLGLGAGVAFGAPLIGGFLISFGVPELFSWGGLTLPGILGAATAAFIVEFLMDMLSKR